MPSKRHQVNIIITLKPKFYLSASLYASHGASFSFAKTTSEHGTQKPSRQQRLPTKIFIVNCLFSIVSFVHNRTTWKQFRERFKSNCVMFLVLQIIVGASGRCDGREITGMGHESSIPRSTTSRRSQHQRRTAGVHNGSPGAVWWTLACVSRRRKHG